MSAPVNEPAHKPGGGGPRQGESRSLPDQVTMGLLEFVTAHALDEDYYARAAQERESGEAGPGRPAMGLGGALALAVFAVLAVTAAAQTSQNSVSDERERRELVSQVQARRHELTQDRTALRALDREVRRIERALLTANSDDRQLVADRELLAIKTGVDPVRGPGVEIVVDDAPNASADRDRVLDSDLQKVVNGLWQAGAEAISINGERLTNLSAIRHAGSAITVNFTSLSRPYRILAIGDSNRLQGDFAETTTGRTWLDLQRQIGLEFTLRARTSIQLPGEGTPQLRHAVTKGKKLS